MKALFEKVVLAQTTDPIKVVGRVGDITVSMSNHLTYVYVDEETVLCIPREDAGLDTFVTLLASTIL
jgi:hypothetical protein